MIKTPPGEPVAAPWLPHRIAEQIADLLAAPAGPPGCPMIVAIDGRQGGGKTTVAKRMAALVEGSAVVHSDDVAWWESFFGWDHLMAEGVLEPLRRGHSIDFRPPAWDTHRREGSIEIPAAAPLVLVEGSGVSRRSLGPLLDLAVWVQSDGDEARRRGIERDGGRQADVDFWEEWEREETPFLAADRPWERADLIVCGTPQLTGIGFDPQTEILIGRSLRP